MGLTVAFQPLTSDKLAKMPARRMARCLMIDNSNLVPEKIRGLPVVNRGVVVVVVVWLYPWCPLSRPSVAGDPCGCQDAREYAFLNWWF